MPYSLSGCFRLTALASDQTEFEKKEPEEHSSRMVRLVRVYSQALNVDLELCIGELDKSLKGSIEANSLPWL